MKKVIALMGMIVVLLYLSATAYADDIMKISMSGEVKIAKAVGNGVGITFTLPDITSDYLINTIEIAIFEKQENETNYKLFGESKLLENPTSLNISFDFGDTSKYKTMAKYKIAYRYYVNPIEDFSKVLIAGAEYKEGWRLVGEINSSIASDNGFMYYKNAVPTININSISYNAETISGEQSFSHLVNGLEGISLPSDVLKKGIAVDYTTNNNDSEDNLTVGYKLIDVIENMVVAEGVLPNTNYITSNYEAEYVKLVLTVLDNWGAFAESPPVTLVIDKDMPEVISEFNNLGRVIKGKNLYSKFTITDDQNDALTNGSVYYTIRKNGVILYNNIAMPNNVNGQYTVDITGMADGVYNIELTIFDKAHNKTLHILSQTLDNTPPSISFLTPTQNEAATLYSTWMNTSKKMILSVTDTGAGANRSYCYLNSVMQFSVSVAPPQAAYNFTYNVTTIKTGKLYYYFYVYDSAVTINKTTNSVNTSASGNSSFVSKYVWLDKTNPTVTINADENEWYSSPKVITADFYDYPSSSSVADNSGVKSKLYCITESNVPSNDWLTYPTDGVFFNTGGVYYLHIKAIDYAGNEALQTKKIKINTPLEITSNVEPTDDYWHTIYNHTNSLYVVKNTAYNTKYHFTLKDEDLSDTLQTEIHLINQDNAEYVSETEVETKPNGAPTHEVAFNLAYIKSDGSALPDGVYSMYVSFKEVKNDGSIIKTTENLKCCELVIKRNAPPMPAISVSNGYITIDYPDETLANSLNRADMKALYKREFKAVIDKQLNSNVYKSYVAPIAIDDMVVTALYTDMAGNISTASKRIYKENADDGNSIATEGNTATIEEGRPATTYYIGTRRDKQTGINNSVLNFLN